MKAIKEFLKEWFYTSIFMLMGLYITLSVYGVVYLFVKGIIFIVFVTGCGLAVEKTYLSVREYEKDRDNKG